MSSSPPPVSDAGESRPPAVEADPGLQVFLAERPRLVRIARQVVGEVPIAEEVVQEAWVRWQRTDRDQVRNPAAFLSTMTTRLAINVIQSASRRHETPSEVLVRDHADEVAGAADISVVGSDPSVHVEKAAVVDETMSLLLARLTPNELAAYVLRKAFDYPYDRIASLLRTSVPNARQLVRRARPGLGRVAGQDVAPAARRVLVEAFLQASRTGELAALEQVLAAHADRGAGVAGPARQEMGRGPTGTRAA